MADWTFAGIEEEIHEAAILKVELNDFGDPSYLRGLRALLQAYDEDDKLSETGRLAARHDLQSTLIKRLRSQQQLRESSAELDSYEIRRPIFITGLVRTGSTALHYLMGQDPNLQPLSHWLAENPIPRPPRDTWESHPNFKRTEKRLHALYSQDRSREAMHFMDASLPEECGHLIAQNFTDDRYIVSTTLPSYAAWYENNDHPETYERHRDLVRLIGSSARDRRWLLKYPVHLRQLPSLLAVYPDACVVQTHRNPATVLRSYTNMVASYRSIFEDDLDREAIAHELLESWAGAADRGVAARSNPGGGQFIDVEFGDFLADPMGTVRRIYSAFDHDLSTEGECALQAWQEANPQGAHGAHNYRKEQFYLSDGEVHERFASYYRHFGLEYDEK